MTTITTPRHRKPRPRLTAKVMPVVTSRKGLVLSGSALSLPATAVSMLSAVPAHATPGGGAVALASPQATVNIPTDVPQNVVYLSYGSTGSLVKTVQQRLGGLQADGVFGPLTQAKVKSFQGSKGLVQDGVVAPLTWSALGGFPVSNNSTSTSPAASACSVQVLRYGARGSLVAAAQQKLGVLTTDGVFGPLTLARVKSFQGSNGIPVTGALDAAVWSALGGFPCLTTPMPNPTSQFSDPGVSMVGSIAKKYLGVSYVWGGSSPSQGFDCSGLTSYVYKQAGLYIPRTASQQQLYMKSTNNPQPGDLVFFGYPAYHVGIYLGHNRMIVAPVPGDVVKIQSIWTTPAGYGTLR